MLVRHGPLNPETPRLEGALRMFKDRYGHPLFSEDGITVFDTSLEYDSELFEDTLGYKLLDYDRAAFSSACEVDIGAGADWPAVAFEVLDTVIPFSSIAAALFFGEKIEKSAMAWKRMVAHLLTLISKNGFTDANGAALLALEKVFTETGARDAKLLAYTWLDGDVALNEEHVGTEAAFDVIAKMDSIEPRERQFGMGLHSAPTFLFKFVAAGDTVLVKVRKKTAEIATN